MGKNYIDKRQNFPFILYPMIEKSIKMIYPMIWESFPFIKCRPTVIFLNHGLFKLC